MQSKRTVCPSGLPPDVISQLYSLAETRARLYAVFLALLAFAVVMVFPTVGAITPRACWLSYAELFFPSPGSLLQPLLCFVEEHCLLAIVWVLALWFIRRTLLWVKATEAEYAFQAWQRTPTLGEKQLTSSLPKLGKCVKPAETIAPARWLTGIVFVVAVLLQFVPDRIF